VKIALAADHAGYELKVALELRLKQLGLEVEDCGAPHLEEGDDFVRYCAEAARRVSKGDADRAIVIGGSGQGEAMIANRFRGVRCAVWYGGSRDIVRLSREHNDANVLSLGARFLTHPEAIHAVEMWLAVPFSGEARHARRIGQIEEETTR
jgi:ribose 5-phosphate isomerase B